MNTSMMKCGHAANARDAKGNPSCVICIGIVPGANEVSSDPPNLDGRMAKCAYYNTCKVSKPSSPNLAFFEYKPNDTHDSYYCGCFGWD